MVVFVRRVLLLLATGITIASGSASYSMVDPQRVLGNVGLNVGASFGTGTATVGGTGNELGKQENAPGHSFISRLQCSLVFFISLSRFSAAVTLPKAATELLQATAADAVAAASVRDSTDLTSTAPSVYNGTGSNATDSNDALWRYADELDTKTNRAGCV